MVSSLPNAHPDLLDLYKSPTINRYTFFGGLTAELDPANLARAYRQLRDSAPRRHDHGKSYFVDHCGPGNRADNSNRQEEHLALSLYAASRANLPMNLPDGRALEILDYQTPLKAQRKDKGVGKIDLFGLIDRRRATVIELKVVPRTGRGDTPLRAYLEALAYCAIVEANIIEIAGDANSHFGITIEERPPTLIVLARPDYWGKFQANAKTGEWWPAVCELADRVDGLLNTDTHFLALTNAAFAMGSKDSEPKLYGDLSVANVAGLYDDKP